MIYNTVLVTHPQKEPFNKLLNQTILLAQNDGLEVEVQFGGKDSGHWNALVVSRSAR